MLKCNQMCHGGVMHVNAGTIALASEPHHLLHYKHRPSRNLAAGTTAILYKGVFTQITSRCTVELSVGVPTIGCHRNIYRRVTYDI